MPGGGAQLECTPLGSGLVMTKRRPTANKQRKKGRKKKPMVAKDARRNEGGRESESGRQREIGGVGASGKERSCEDEPPGEIGSWRGGWAVLNR